MKDLRTLFDYQRFEGNSRLAAMIEATEARYMNGRQALDEDDLFMVNAAGNKDQFEGNELPGQDTVNDPLDQMKDMKGCFLNDPLNGGKK